MGSVPALERRLDLGADLVTARSDARTDSRNQVIGPNAETGHQVADDPIDNTRRQTAPSRVNGRNGPALAIGQQDRGAIGDPDRDRHVGRGRNDRVGLRTPAAGPALRRIADRDDRGPVDLVEPQQTVRLDADLRGERPPARLGIRTPQRQLPGRKGVGGEGL